MVKLFISGTQGGATPGKLFMGLRIYRCDQVGR